MYDSDPFCCWDKRYNAWETVALHYQLTDGNVCVDLSDNKASRRWLEGIVICGIEAANTFRNPIVTLLVPDTE